MSTRMPFALFLNVGGKSENIAKWTVCPEAGPPSTETKKLLSRADVEVVGLKDRLTCTQDVWVPLRVVVAEPRMVPLLERRPTVAVPEKDEDVGKR